MSKEEYLNEEKNKNISKKLKIIAFLILTITIVIGGSLIFNSIKKNNYNKSKEGINARIEIDKQISKLKDEQSEELRKNSKSDQYYDIEFKIEELKKQKEDLQEGLEFGVPIGIFIIFVGLAISGRLLFTANMRKMEAYQVQQAIPIVQEFAEKMAPTAETMAKKMAPTAGIVAKEIAKGVKEGLKDDEK